jgi:uncharacterized membrane protein YfcA
VPPHPSALVLALLVASAFVAGVVDAIAGGGGLITLPALLGAGLPAHLALGTNKGQSIFGSSTASLAYFRRGALDLRRALVTFPFALCGSAIGAVAANWLSPQALRPVVLVLLPCAAVTLLVRKPDRTGAEKPSRSRALVLSAMLAFVVGGYDGFFGPGTGTFLILGFVVLLHEPLVAATADAKVANFGSNCAAVAVFAMNGHILWRVALPMAGAQLTGAWVGAHVAVRGGDRLIKRVVVLVVLGLCVKLAYDLLHH